MSSDLRQCDYLLHFQSLWSPAPVYFIGKSHLFRLATVEEVSHINKPTLTYDTWEALPPKDNIPSTENLIDMTLAEKLLRPDRIKSLRAPSSVWEVLRDRGLLDDSIKAIYSSLRSNCKIEDVFSGWNLKGMFVALEKLWLAQYQEMHSASEFKRYLDIECKVNSCLLRYRKGIAIDAGAAQEAILGLERQALIARRAIKHEFGIDRPEDYIGFIRKGSAHDIPTDGHQANLNNAIISLKKYFAVMKNRKTILRLGSSFSSRVDVIMDTFGTQSGRIIVRDPPLQNLPARFRHVLKADVGHQLLYIDFSHYEVCILAAETGDELLGADLQSGDVYDSFAKALGLNEGRETAKMLFLSILYGITEASLQQILPPSAPNAHDLILNIHKRYRKIRPWQIRIWTSFLKDGRIGSAQGNFRKRLASGALSDRERRVAVSQRIQGSGSLILKQALIRTSESHPEFWPLLPMHDAVLYQVPSEMLDSAATDVVKEFEAAFQQVYSGTYCRALVKDFS